MIFRPRGPHQPYPSLFHLALALAALLSAGASASAASDSESRAFAPEHWGFQAVTTTPPGAPGSLILTLRNPETGRVVTQVFSPLGRIESESETTASGRILWRREIRTDGASGQTVEERFEPEHVRAITHAAAPDRELPGPHLVIETTHWNGSVPRTTKLTIPRDEALSACAAREMPVSQAERLMSDLRWLQFQPASQARGAVALANNVVLENCDRYPGGGNAAVAKALEDGLNQGLRCFKSLGAARSADIARLLSYLDPKLSAPVRIQCGQPGKLAGRGGRKTDGSYESLPLTSEVNAQAFHACDGDFPGLLLNVESENFRAEPGQLKATLFHEMLHFLGYLHAEGVDIPYLADACCFAEGKGASSVACDMLKNGADFRSAAYQTQFAEMMTHLARPSIAEDAAWAAAAQADPAKTNPLYGAARKLAELNSGSPLRYLMLAHTGVALSPKSERERLTSRLSSKLPAWQRQGAQAVGQSLAAILRKDAAAFQRAWPQTRDLRTRICARGSQDEKAQLAETLKSGFLGLYDSFGSDLFLKYAREMREPCGS